MRIKERLKTVLPKWVLHLYWLSMVTRVKLIKWVPSYNEDELLTGHNCDFMKDPHFKKCYDAAVKAGLAVSDKIHWRAHVACWAASYASRLEGDFIECGVNKGFLSKIVIDFIDFKSLPKTFYLLDTFEGFADRYLVESERRKIEQQGSIYKPCYEFVLKIFLEHSNVRIIKGVVPDTLPQVSGDRIAYLSIDMNCVQPEIAAAEFFWPKLVQGGVMLLDDYGHAGHELQKEAFDKFALRHSTSILCLPTGQGLIFKT